MTFNYIRVMKGCVFPLLEFILKYWLGWLFGLVAVAITFIVKRHFKLEQKDYQQKQKERMDELRSQVKDEIIDQLDKEVTQLKEEDLKVHEEIVEIKHSVNTMTEGVLAIHGRDFKDECRRLLQPEHTITLDEYEQICKDHKIYNKLGGNDRGDALFEAVVTKYNSSLKQ